MSRKPKNLKCPTCEGAKRGNCCSCGKHIPLEKQNLSPNPYSNEINDDDRLHLICADCYEDFQGDI
jgi:hypothetical protein